MNIFEKIREFCMVGGQPAPTEVTQITEERKTFRLSLIKEEFEELMKAVEENDEIEERDAIIDMIYVLGGLAVERGYSDLLDDDFNMVHDNNMSKFCRDEEDARLTVAHYKRQNVNCSYEQHGEFYVVKREDGKILKSITWRKPVFQPKNILS